MSLGRIKKEEIKKARTRGPYVTYHAARHDVNPEVGARTGQPRMSTCCYLEMNYSYQLSNLACVIDFFFFFLCYNSHVSGGSLEGATQGER